MSFLPTGTVYGTALNFRGEHEALGARMSESPHKASPIAPVLYVKPANTWTPDGRSITLPFNTGEIWVNASISMLIGPNALVHGSSNAIEYVAGYVLMNDLSLPQPNLFRPPVRYNCVDGFLGVGSEVVPAADAGDSAAFTLEVRIDGELKQTISFSDLVRSAPQLLTDVSDFMSLHPGDLLMLGYDVLGGGQRLTARAGQRIDISSPGFPSLSNTLVAEAA